MLLYKTVRGRAEASQIIEKSRFITTVMPVQTREEADRFFDEIRTKYKDATHNVPAMVVGDKMQLQWGSDDGEPQGTSGAPIVQMLVKEGVTNVALVVTRYFGGIKLGTGGLVRAYTSSAKLGIDAAGVCGVKEMNKLLFKVDYSSFNKIQSYQFEFEAIISDIEYGGEVSFSLAVNPEDREKAMGIMNNLSAGTIEFTGAEDVLCKI